MNASTFLLLRTVACITLVAITAACSSLFSAVDVKPIHTAASDPSVLPDEDMYRDAVGKINDRDYGGALDFLQLARSRAPADGRVYNAMGVVYDKLGRFDLSARYYAQAKYLSPNPKIVDSNIAYSAALQKQMKAPSNASTAVAEEQYSAAPTTNVPEEMLHRADSGISPTTSMKLAAEPSVTALIPDFVRAWGGVVILANLEDTFAVRVSKNLTRHRWAISKSILRILQSPAQTTIQYAPSHFAAAKSLAHTLPFPTRLAACENGCHGVILLLGTDHNKRRDKVTPTVLAGLPATLAPQ